VYFRWSVCWQIYEISRVMHYRLSKSGFLLVVYSIPIELVCHALISWKQTEMGRECGNEFCPFPVLIFPYRSTVRSICIQTVGIYRLIMVTCCVLYLCFLHSLVSLNCRQHTKIPFFILTFIIL